MWPPLCPALSRDTPRCSGKREPRTAWNAGTGKKLERGEAEVRWVITLTFLAKSILQEITCILPCQPLWSIHMSKFPLLLSLCCAVNMKTLSWELPLLGAEADTIHHFTDE